MLRLLDGNTIFSKEILHFSSQSTRLFTLNLMMIEMDQFEFLLKECVSLKTLHLESCEVYGFSNNTLFPRSLKNLVLDFHVVCLKSFMINKVTEMLKEVESLDTFAWALPPSNLKEIPEIKKTSTLYAKKIQGYHIFLFFRDTLN